MNSRRNIIKKLAACAGLAAFAAGALAGTGAKTGTNKRARRATMGGQKVFAHYHPKFDAVLGKYFPKSANSQVFQEQLRPFSVIIVNKAKVPVYGYRIRWNSKRGSGVADAYDRTIVKTPSDGFTKRSSSLSAPLVRPGEAMLVTPLVALNSGLYRAGLVKEPEKTIYTTQLLDKKRAKLPVAAGYTSRNGEHGGAPRIRLSAVVFATRVVGRQAGKTANELRNRMNAEHDVAEDLLLKFASGKGAVDLSAVRAELHNIREEVRRIPRSEATPYDSARKSFASRLSSIVRPGRQGDLVAVLRKLAKQPQSNLR